MRQLTNVEIERIKLLTEKSVEVALIEPTATKLNPAKKGKKVTRAQMFAELNKGMKEWGKEGARRIWISQL